MKTTKGSHIFFICWVVWQFAASEIYLLLPIERTLVNAFLFVQLAGNLIPVAAAYIISLKNGVSFIAIKKPDLNLAILSVMLSMLIMPLGMLVSLLTSISGVDNAVIEQLSAMPNAFGFIPGLMLMALLPAVTEELVRGTFLTGYRNVNITTAALINGVFFGLMHMNFRQFFYAFVLGFFIALVVIRSGSIIYGIIMHFAVNGTQFALARFAAAAAELVDEAEHAAEVSETTMLVTAGVILFALTVMCTWGWRRVYKRFGLYCDRLYPKSEETADMPQKIESNAKISVVTLAIGVILCLAIMLAFV